jgi:hypothetical protein
VPAGTQYNLICNGTAQSRQVLNGTITETSRVALGLRPVR